MKSMPSAFSSYKPGYMQVFGCICLDTQGNVILVRGKQSKKWSFPKGHKKRNETSLQCAKRELWEETGILAPATYKAYYKMKGGEYFVFELDTIDFTINDTVEIDKVEWIPLNDLPVENTNIDVSIFRSHLRRSFSAIENTNILTIRSFIGSCKSINAIHTIHNQIVKQESIAFGFHT